MNRMDEARHAPAVDPRNEKPEVACLCLPPGRVAAAATSAAAVTVRAGAVATAATAVTATTTTATATTSSATTTTASTVVSHLLELGGNVTLALLENLEEFTSRLGVLGGEEGERGTLVAGTTGTTDSVDVVLAVVGEIVVDDVLDVLDVCRLKVRVEASICSQSIKIDSRAGEGIGEKRSIHVNKAQSHGRVVARRLGGRSRMADPKQRTRCADMHTGAQHHESNCGCAWHRTELD
jgi:hypothetical protein